MIIIKRGNLYVSLFDSSLCFSLGHQIHLAEPERDWRDPQVETEGQKTYIGENPPKTNVEEKSFGYVRVSNSQFRWVC